MNIRCPSLLLFPILILLLPFAVNADFVDGIKLIATDGASQDSFGWSVSISGDTAIVGAPVVDTNGAAYIFERDPATNNWAQTQKLQAFEGAGHDRFGGSVSISGDSVIVGVKGDDDNGQSSGSAYIFVRDPDTGVWAQQQKLLASDGAAYHIFGKSVAISGDAVIVGADYSTGIANSTGFAYIFVRDPATGVWTEQEKLAPSDGVVNDYFGQSVAIDGETAVVGSGLIGGRVYTYEYNSGTDNWDESKLIRTNTSEYVGPYASIQGDIAITGAPYITSYGSAYIFERNPVSGDWAEQQMLVQPNATRHGNFGAAVAIDSDLAVIGAYTTTNGGAAYAFVRDPDSGVWGSQKLQVSDDGALRNFGHSVSVDGDTVIVGAQGSDGIVAYTGAAYVYTPAVPNITVTDSVVPTTDLSVPFGDVTELSSSDQTLAISNDGDANLIVGTIAQTDPLAAPFSILNDNCSIQTLAPAASCDFTVRFSPASTGIFNDSFNIPSNDPDESSVTINLSGTGVIIDLDGDTYSPPEDCDDTNSNINPSMDEMCNGFDDNCDGAIDEGFSASEILDLDGDSIPACIDNCLNTANQNQIDSDGDGVGDACTASAVLKSPRIHHVPIIDGDYKYGEWPYNSENQQHLDNQLDLQNGFVRVFNDGVRLYILIDLLDDSVDNREAPRDYFNLTFDVNNDGLITPATDLYYSLNSDVANIRYRYYKGADDWSPIQPETFSSMARGFDCNIDDGSQTFTNTFHPDTCNRHRIWELAIDLEEIHASAGSTVSMGLQVASPEPSFSENFPVDVTSSFSKLVEIQLSSAPPIWADYQTGHVRFELDAIEITQAIQNQQSTLPLVQDKDTVARVYVHSHNPNPNIPLPTKSLLSLYAYSQDSGADLPGSPLTKIYLAPQLINRDNLNDTANFLLPKSWTQGEVVFHAIARGIEHNDSGDVAQVVPITFTPKKIPTYWTIRLNTGSENTPDQVRTDELLEQENYLKTVFPLADVNYIRKPWESVGVTTTVDSIADLRDYYHQVLMGWAFGAYLTGTEPFKLPDQIYGMTVEKGGLSEPVWAGGGREGIVARGGNNAEVIERIDGIPTKWLTLPGIMAHEINHNLGPGDCQNRVGDGMLDDMWGRHVSSRPRSYQQRNNPASQCILGEDSGVIYGDKASGPDPDWQELFDNADIGDFGFDTRPSPFPWAVLADGLWGRSTVIPPDLQDFMSYSEQDLLPRHWVSSYRWERLFNRFENADLAPQARSMADGANQSLKSVDINQIADMYYISGQLNDDGTGTLNPSTTAPGTPNLPSDYGDYHLQFVDASGAIIQDYTFDVSFIDLEEESLTMVPFYFRIPVITNTAVAAIHLLNAQVSLASIVVSDNPPQVTILSPNGGERWSNSGTISWTGSDADDDPLTYSLLYSPDNGNLWLPVARNLLTTSYTVDTSIMMGGDNAIFRVIATDGFHTAMDDSDQPFILDQNPPDVVIHTPLAGDIFPDNRNISFCGNATDPEDETLPEDAFAWVLNSKVIGLGRCIEATLLAGLQEVTLQVTDSHGSSSEDSVQIEVFASSIWYLDLDDDGFGQMEECNDNDQSIHPKAVELCDGIDNNCDGQIDGGLDDDADGIGEVCDDDDDNDGVLDSIDNCTLTINFDQTDNDSDGIGDVCDFDDDNDRRLDNADNCPAIANASQIDFDLDGSGDVCDLDDDNDGMPDNFEILYGLDPLDASNASQDFDGDGFTNLEEFMVGTDPKDPNSNPNSTIFRNGFE